MFTAGKSNRNTDFTALMDKSSNNLDEQHLAPRFCSKSGYQLLTEQP